MSQQPEARFALAFGFVLVIALLVATLCVLITRETRRAQVGADAVDRIDRRGQEIVNAAFPARIGAAPYQGVSLEEVHRRDDGYRALVTLRYTNILDDENYMQIELNYDHAGSFLHARIHKCNDRWASPAKLISLASAKLTPQAAASP
jgi:hypothetical protein